MTRWLVPALLFVTACTGSDAIGPDSEIDVPVEFSVSDIFESDGGAQFLFLQPLSNGKPSEPLATGLELTVTICDASDVCVVLEAIEQDDHYRANWKSDKKRADEDFSVVVTGFGILLGKLTLGLENRGSEKAGRTFPIKFWVGEGIGAVVAEIQDCEEANLCNSEPVPPGIATTITTVDDDGDAIAEIIFPPLDEDELPDGLIVTVDCRSEGFTLPDGPLPTALDQFPAFCNIDVFNPDGTSFEGDLPNNAEARLEICELNDVTHPDAVLGKSDGGVFKFLDPIPDFTPNLVNCDDVTITAMAGPAERTLRWLGSRVASLLHPLVPQKLYARALRFRRDGGVGGLITSFTPVNPVLPAFIKGTVKNNVGAGLADVEVTLELGVSDETATTDGNGAYSFLTPLAAAPGGTTYTVTVSETSLPSGQELAEPVQEVLVTGSGLFDADFVTAGTILIYGPSMQSLDAIVDPVTGVRYFLENEQTFAEAEGFTVTVADATAWGFLTTAQFESFSAIVFGDVFADPGDRSALLAAEANRVTWSAAVTGPIVVSGMNPQTHQCNVAFVNNVGPLGSCDNEAEAPTLVKNLINFAASGTGTGLYASLSRYYHDGDDDPVNVDFLDKIGVFKVEGLFSGRDNNAVTIDLGGHPVMAGLTNAGLSGWGASIHAFHETFPITWITLATGGIAGVGPGTLPVIIATPGS